MLKRVLIANRGEIAVRIARTARRLGMGTVAVYSAADRHALHVAAADAAVAIGDAPARDSYLNIDRIIAAARDSGCDSIHPGYGFLAENADFAAACAAAGLIFVGPTPAAMRALGGKAAAKDIAIAAGIPVVPGYQGAAQDLATLTREACRIGFPLMIKAVAGGGGRGMRLVERQADLAAARTSAMQEAAAAFGDDRILIEKLVAAPRHIEVQIFGDTHGNVVHLYERDCSLQRRHQKVIEEAPAPGMSPPLRDALTRAAVTLARAVGYTGAGTVEFLVEGGALSADAPWYFIEMNTRLQVEHPVTEAITGLDLVAWQFAVAAGAPLPLAQNDITICGHAIEARLNAEDPAHGFLPSIGRIESFAAPAGDGLRVETGIATGSAVSPWYDSMLAKLIAAAPDRPHALDRLADALRRTCVLGLPTNARFLAALLADPDVRAGRADTGLIGRRIDGLAAVPAATRAAARAAAARALIASRATPAPAASPQPWQTTDAFALGTPASARDTTYTLACDGRQIAAHATWTGAALTVSLDGTPAPGDGTDVHTATDGATAWASVDLHHETMSWPAYTAEAAAGAGSGAVTAPIDGRLTALFVMPGQHVAAGDRIANVEAMKMEHVLAAPKAGRIARVDAAAGTQVARGALIAEIDET